jgi:hypothetical protein
MGALEDMESLGQSDGILMAVDGVVSNIDRDPCQAEGTCIVPSSRRLLVSSAAYRIRVRRMLLRKIASGTTAAAISPNSAPSITSACSTLLSTPEEVTFQSGNSTMDVLSLTTSNQLSDQLRGGGLISTCTLCQESVAIANRSVVYYLLHLGVSNSRHFADLDARVRY